MPLTQSALWKKIEDYQIGPHEAHLSFSKRLARENGWDMPFAEQAILEYKKFCYLSVVCEHAVTPSDEVDQVWHLHLQYTQDYWIAFCPDILGCALHHGPTAGGTSERKKYLSNYRQTLSSYELEFDTYPPTNFWPEEEIRFGKAPFFQRINTKDYILLPQPQLSGVSRVSMGWVLALLGLLGLGVAAKSEMTGSMPIVQAKSFDFLDMLLIFIALATLVALYRVVVPGKNKNKHTKRTDSGCGGVGCVGESSSGSGRSSSSKRNRNDDDDSTLGDSGCSGCGGCGD